MLPLVFVLGIALQQSVPAPPARIEGTVVDTLCAAVADAEVVALVQGREVARARSDAGGAFVLADLPHEIAAVRARGKGLAFAVARVDLTGDDFAAPRLQCFASRTLTGHVAAGGKPVAGAQVIAEPEDLPEFADAPPLAVTGADGSYRLEGVVIGPVVVRAWAPGCALVERQNEGPGDAVVDFAMSNEDVGELVVRVRGASPAQLASARVLVAAARGSTRKALPPALACAVPGEDGVARVRGWPPDFARAEVIVRIPGATTSPWRTDRLGLHGEAADFAVLPPAASVLRGVVRGPDGRPIAHRQLLVQPYDDAPWSLEVVRGETGDDGSFALRCPVDKGEKFALRLVDDEWRVDQWRPDEPAGRAWHVAAFDPEAALQVAALQVAAVAAFDLRVRLRTPDGRPLGGALLLVTGSGDGGSAGPLVIGSGWSRADGGAELIGLDAGHGLCVESPEWLVRELEITGDLDRRITSAMRRAGSIAGRVIVADRPIAGARVRLVQRNPTSHPILLPAPRITVTDGEGRFRFDGLRGLPTELTAMGLGSPVRCQATAGEETAVTLR